MIAGRARRRLLHVPSADWDGRQIRQALRMRPVHGNPVSRLEQAAERVLGVPVIAFGSARSALAAVLLADPPASGKVVVAAYTCVAVPNAIRAAGAQNVWVDVVGPNIDPDAARRAAMPGDAILAQHTYGVPIAREIAGAARQRAIRVIEDRAHRFDGTDLHGDAAVFSLEHSKVISGGQGGLAWARDDRVMAELGRMRDTWPPVDGRTAARVLRTSATQAALARLGGPQGVGNSLVRRIALRLPALSVPGQSEDELAGSGIQLSGPHPVMAEIGITSLRRLAATMDHRRWIADVYRAELGDLVPGWSPPDVTLVRMPVLVSDAASVARSMRERGWDLGPRWFDASIHPAGSISDYVPGSAPAAERLSASVLTLPTHALIDKPTARRIAVAVLAAVALRT